MCTPGIHLKFCTCNAEAIAAIEADRQSNAFIWTLYRKSPPTDAIPMMGRILMPIQQLGNVLNQTLVLEQLNSPSCFDFDYQPQAGDQLRISQASDYDYMYFEYQTDSGWKPSWPKMDEDVEAIRSGKVELR